MSRREWDEDEETDETTEEDVPAGWRPGHDTEQIIAGEQDAQENELEETDVLAEPELSEEPELPEELEEAEEPEESEEEERRQAEEEKRQQAEEERRQAEEEERQQAEEERRQAEEEERQQAEEERRQAEEEERQQAEEERRQAEEEQRQAEEEERQQAEEERRQAEEEKRQQAEEERRQAEEEERQQAERKVASEPLEVPQAQQDIQFQGDTQEQKKLQEGFELLKQSEAGQLAVQAMEREGTSIRFGDAGGDIARYSPQENSIVLDKSLEKASSPVIASHLAHEGIHASHRWDQNSIQEEYEAYYSEDAVWQETRGQERDPQCDWVSNELIGLGEKEAKNKLRQMYLWLS